MTIAEANEPLSNGLKIIIAQKGLKNLYVAESAGYTPQELSDRLICNACWKRKQSIWGVYLRCVG